MPNLLRYRPDNKIGKPNVIVKFLVVTLAICIKISKSIYCARLLTSVFDMCVLLACVESWYSDFRLILINLWPFGMKAGLMVELRSGMDSMMFQRNPV